MGIPIIEVKNLSKRYHIGEGTSYNRFTEKISDTFKHPINAIHRVRLTKEEFWALRNISFNVQPGEIVGVIGRNGAGKSTLLKILSEITYPTEGEVVLRGRVGSLLEVGTGFHPELTGRENIYLNGAILGMKKSNIDENFDEIVKFAEIEKFIDTPVKRYSSGMYVRLAFAVGAYLQPDILVVDEVLAVGDAQFQKKCLGKMKAISEGGRTVIFVSHNMSAVSRLCTRGILLHDGKIMYTGEVDEAINKYIEADKDTVAMIKMWDDLNNAPGNEIIRIKKVQIIPEEQGKNNSISVRDAFNIVIEFWNNKPSNHLSLAMHLKTLDDSTVMSSTTWREKDWNNKPFNLGLYRCTCKIPGDLLNEGPYKIRLLFVENSVRVICELNDILSFSLNDSYFDKGDWHGKWPGVFRPILDWKTEFIDKQLY